MVHLLSGFREVCFFLNQYRHSWNRNCDISEFELFRADRWNCSKARNRGHMLDKTKLSPKGCLILLYLGAFGVVPAAMGQTYVFFDLPNTYYTYPLSVNSNGAVTGFATFGGTRLAFIRDPAGTITTFSAGSGFTVPVSINDSGIITGTVGRHGFLRSPGGTIIVFDPTGSVNTLPRRINAAGSVVGYYFDAQNNAHGFVQPLIGPGFVLNPPNGGLVALDINASGALVGFYGDPSGTHGFLRDPGGTFISIDVPGAISTQAISINDAGAITGWYQQVQGVRFIGFVRDPAGNITSFSPELHTKPLSINSEGAITGSTGGTLLGDGFVRSPSGTIVVFDAPGCLATHGISINDQGVIAGWCDVGFRGRAFLRYP